MQVDVSSLKSLLMSWESEVAEILLTAVWFRFCPAPNRRSKVSKIMHPLKVTKSQKIISFSFYIRRPMSMLLGYFSFWTFLIFQGFYCATWIKGKTFSVCHPFVEIYTLIKPSFIFTLVTNEKKGKFLIFFLLKFRNCWNISWDHDFTHMLQWLWFQFVETVNNFIYTGKIKHSILSQMNRISILNCGLMVPSSFPNI